MSRHRCRICLVLLQGSDYIFIHPIKGGACVSVMNLFFYSSLRYILSRWRYSLLWRNKSLQGYTCNYTFVYSLNFFLRKNSWSLSYSQTSRGIALLLFMQQGFTVISKDFFCTYYLFDDCTCVATGSLLTHPDLVKVPNCAVDMNSWAQLACYPRGSFYPLICTGV